MTRTTVRRPVTAGTDVRRIPADVHHNGRSPASHWTGTDLLGRRALGGRPDLIRSLQATAGNAAVSLMLQRKAGWPDASTEGPAWNDARPKAVGQIWRLAIAGLTGGIGKPFKGGTSVHTTEGADHRAIVLVPEGFKPDKPVEVLLYFHGHTEAWRKQYAGLRQRSFKETKATEEAGLTNDNTVRDVALDQIEQQLDKSGHRQMIGILAQGGPQHEFGIINTDDYIRDALTRTTTEFPTKLKGIPSSWSVILSGHSGGGFAVQAALSGKNTPEKLKGLILFDAEAMHGDMRRRISDDMKFLVAHTDAERDAHLAKSPVVRAFTSKNSVYADRYKDIVEVTIAATTDPLFPRSRRADLARLRTRAACVPLTPAEDLRLKELRRDAPTDQAGRTELQGLQTRKACKRLSAGESRRMTDLIAQETTWLSVMKYLPKVREIYQLTALDSPVKHEEIIRNADTGSGEYHQGQGNLERALRSIP